MVKFAKILVNANLTIFVLNFLTNSSNLVIFIEFLWVNFSPKKIEAVFQAEKKIRWFSNISQNF